MSDHEHGSMDVYDQEKTYNGFLKLGKWTAIICIAIVAFLALTST
ncbi:MAG: aa3-type cytochrome c oxidase subunit IV [Rhodobacteraceae bacterium]|nr:aa3-type cytochrome c oxidase subunit IV [Paracoccaceae bacterium]